MEQAGLRLKKLRLEKGISLEEVHKKTRIHINILKAIEGEAITSLSPVYLKSFLKLYCHFLGVNPKDYIPDYKETRTAVSIPEPENEKPVLQRNSFLKNASCALGSIRPSKRVIKNLFFTVIVLVVFIGIYNLGKSIASRRHTAVRENKLLPVKAAASSARVTEKEVPSSITLGIRARERCMVTLTVDGKLRFQGVLDKGRFQRWQARERIDFSLGNAGAVELELNGRTIPAVGRKGQSVKNIVFTREKGLIVPQ